MRRIETLAIMAGLAIVVAACSNPAASTAPSSPPPASSAPVSEAPPSTAPTAMKVGYISLGEAIPFVSLVTNSIKDEAAKVPGLEIVVCDSEIDAAKALACAQNLKVQKVQAVLNFQLFEDSSPEVCTAYGGLPTIAIDIHQAPCEVAFMGADNTLAGTLAGKTVGDALKAENDCAYTAVVTLDTKGAGATTLARMNGMIAGFEEACGKIDPAKFKSIDVGGTTDLALEKFGNQLSAIKPGGIIAILSLNDDMSLGAFAAARTAGREKEIRLAGQGADPTSWKEIACNPQWLADTAYFPERYGTILVPAVVDLLNGKTVEKNLFTKHETVTKDNVRTMYPATPAC
ncbi:MAG: ribose transport system substrate-binding protein [Chloroflexota bacterium]|jgi:ribose transport system substrate-binding protein|nr:ribose transport system substrate-binding protein [Chloroflexota bacterium]MEA2612829.1 ribose transport system substrate-binding protein [Chloroflexota bacterium]